MNRSRLSLCSIIAFLILASPASAQINEGGYPVDFGKAVPAPVQTISTPAVDIAAYLAEDKIEEEHGLPFRFGAPFDVNYSLGNSGSWQTLLNGDRVWRLRISSPSAYSLNLIYDRYHLPEGARLYIYNEDKSMVIGAFTARNNKDHGQFATGPVKGDISVLEYFEPAAVAGQGEISISRIVHAYRNIFDESVTKDLLGFGDAGSCNNNINCPEGQPWQNEKRSVAMILTAGGTRLCTGALVNNVRYDQTPYFLTANHCLGTEATWVFMFNYESPDCSNMNGPTTMTLSGSTRRATLSASDFALLELSEQPPQSYAPYFSGWSNINLSSTSSTCIHHPSGDIKKISFDNNTVISTEYLSTSPGTTHWRIVQWEDGTTEGGSSGSPLYDQNRRIVGQLHGGHAACNNPTASDWFGKFSYSWEGGGTAATRLKDWLDPDNTSATTLEGYDPFASVLITHTGLSDTRDTVYNHAVVCTIISSDPLVPSELLLHYNVGIGWNTNLLTATGLPDEYAGSIPAQPAGTTIQYFLTAFDNANNSDTTQTFSFQILYSPSIAVTPQIIADTLVKGDSTTELLIIQSVGTGPLTYNLSLNPVYAKRTLTYPNLDITDLGNAVRTLAIPDKSATISESSPVLQSETATPFAFGGPDAFGYIWIDSDQPSGPVLNWADISATGTDIVGQLIDDSYSGPYPIGFSFPYYGGVYTQFYVGSNGIIGLDTAGMEERIGTTLPNAAVPNNILAWLWDDLNPNDINNPGAHVYYKTENNRLIVQFVNYPKYQANPGETITAEVILEPSGAMYFQYLTIAGGFDVTTGTVGIENSTGTIGHELAYNEPYLKNNLAVKFYMPYPWLSLSKTSGTIPPGLADTVICTFTSAGLDSGDYIDHIVITSNDPDPGDSPDTVMATAHVIWYICGDANADRAVNIGDAVFIVNLVFKNGPLPVPYKAGDANGDSSVNVGDGIFLLNFIFKGGPAPCP